MRRATARRASRQQPAGISIHALLAESDRFRGWPIPRNKNFYPRSPCGERHANLRRHRGNDNFYPRSPCGERRKGSDNTGKLQAFLSTLSLRRATMLHLLGWLRVLISIHALLAESDQGTASRINGRIDFYPRSPCGERHSLNQGLYRQRRFLSTLSLRRATVVHSLKLANSMLFLSTLSLRRATQCRL